MATVLCCHASLLSFFALMARSTLQGALHYHDCQAAPSKKERLEKAAQQMREYAKTAQFHMAEEVEL